MSDEIKRLFVSFCLLQFVTNPDDLDDLLEEYPQLGTFYENLLEFAYADEGAIFPQLLCNVGLAYKNGTEYFKKNPEKALEYFLLGADLDYDGRQSIWPFAKVADCAFEAAVCYMEGSGTEKDYHKALEYFERGASEYGESAVPAMGDILIDPDFKGWKAYYNDYEELFCAAFDAYNTRAHRMGYYNCNPYTNYLHVDYCYSEYYDEEKIDNLRKAMISNLEILAERESKEAAARLAIAYEIGLIVEKDPAKALQYHQLVMEQGGDSASAKYVFEHSEIGEREDCGIPTNLKVGDRFEYGLLLEQPIIWQVLKKDEESVTVISEDVIACMPFDDCKADYATSSVRKWLNETFYEKVFTENEKKWLEINKIETSSSINNGDALVLEDRVFILTSSEIKELFDGNNGNFWKITHTGFAIHTGGETSCWTREASGRTDIPMHVNEYGEKDDRVRYCYNVSLGVRPAIRLKTK
jgi:TPR repeat protein